MSASNPSFGDTFQFWLNPKSHYKENPSFLKRWAKKVYMKYNYTCFRCEYKAGGNLRLEAHHIYPKSKHPKLAYKVSNGVCLCEVCHRIGEDSYHALNGNKGNPKMLNKWLSRNKKHKTKDIVSLTALIFASIIIIGFISILVFNWVKL